MARVTEGAGATSGDSLGLPARLSLIVTAVLAGLALTGLTPVLGAITAHYAGRPGAATTVRLLVTIVSAMQVIGAPLAGLLAERIGTKRVLLGSLVLYALAGSAGFFIDDPAGLLASRAVLGIGSGAVGVTAMTLITLRIPGHEQHRWLGFYSATGTVGTLILVPIIGRLGGVDWRLVFPLHLIALPVLLAIAATVSAVPIAGAPRAAGPGRAAAVGGAGFPWGLLVVALSCGVATAAFSVYLPFHLVSLGVRRPELIAAAFLPNAACTGLLSLLYGAIRRRADVTTVFAAGFAASAIGLLVIVAAGGLPQVLVGTAFIGVATGLIAPNLFAAAALVTRPERRARTVGVVRAGFSAAPLLSQLPLEPIANGRGPGSALAAVAVFSIVATGAVLLGRRSFVPPPAA